jgi:protoporphyrinogen oxidase
MRAMRLGVPIMAKVGVIGAGAMGLSAAYYALKAEHRVTVPESDSIPGGMAAHFDFGGLSIERFYHFVCKADQPTFDLMRDLCMATSCAGSAPRWAICRRSSL